MECSICCATFTSKTRAPVACPFCTFRSCTGCVKTYLLQTTQDPHCMSCRSEWSPEFVDETLSKSFRTNSLAKHRRDVLLEREKAKLPDSVQAADKEKRKREVLAEAGLVAERIKELKAELSRAKILYTDLTDQAFYIDRTKEKETSGGGQRFVRACPGFDCRGFLSSQWKCQLCEMKVCKKCHQPDGDEHVCDPGDVATAELLSKDTKPCPHCSSMITKVDGCDQMWCTQCKTAFSWITGKEERGVIHNPEYFRWMRDHGHELPRQPGDDGPCDQPVLPSLYTLTRVLQEKKIVLANTASYLTLLNALRFLIHTRQVTLADMRAKLYRGGRAAGVHVPGNPPPDDPDLDLRIQYLLHELSEDQWKTKLLQREKRREKLRAGVQMIDMLVTAGTEVINKFRSVVVIDQLDEIVRELDALRVYCNEQLERVAKRFGSTLIPMIDANWTL